MSGNIKDTNVQLIKNQVESLIVDLDELQSKNESIEDWDSTLQNRYKQLYKMSNLLFQFIINQYKKLNFDKKVFRNTLELMLTKILDIQNGEVTQDNASVSVGDHLAKRFIPQYKK